jgi:PPM family protein phosphatase
VKTGRSAARTDTGRRRLHNEDVFVCEPPVYAVADGMGGAQAGELAASLAAAALAEATAALRGEEAAAELVREANRRVFRRSVEDPAAAGMGTTVTLLLVDEPAGTAAVAHVGDSRAYRIRDGQLDQLTLDHSVVGELVRAGRLTEEEALDHPYRSAITRVLGTEEDVDVDTLTVELQPGDLYLVCSDGLTSMVRDEEILAKTTAHDGNPEAVAAALIDAANSAGGDDNITVVLFEVVAGEPAAYESATPDPAPPLDAVDHPSAVAESPVRRSGAGPGSRWPALLLIVAIVTVAALLVLLGLTR